MMFILSLLSVVVPLIATFVTRRAYKACVNSRCAFFTWPLLYAGIVSAVNAMFSAWAWHVPVVHIHTGLQAIALAGSSVISVLLGVVVIVFSVVIEEASSKKRET